MFRSGSASVQGTLFNQQRRNCRILHVLVCFGTRCRRFALVCACGRRLACPTRDTGGSSQLVLVLAGRTRHAFVGCIAMTVTVRALPARHALRRRTGGAISGRARDTRGSSQLALVLAGRARHAVVGCSAVPVTVRALLARHAFRRRTGGAISGRARDTSGSPRLCLILAARTLDAVTRPVSVRAWTTYLARRRPTVGVCFVASAARDARRITIRAIGDSVFATGTQRTRSVERSDG